MMVLCKFYQQGNCRYGNTCKFEHPRGGFDDVEGVSPLLRSSQQHVTPASSSSRAQHNQQNVFANRHSQNVFSSRPQPHEQSVFAPRPASSATDVRDIYKVLIQELEVSERSGQWPLSCLNPLPSRVHGNLPGLEDHSPEELRCLLYEARASGALEGCKRQIEMLYQQAKARKNIFKSPNAEIFSILEALMRGPIPTPQQSLFQLSGVAHDSWPTTSPSSQMSIFNNSTSSIVGPSHQSAFGAPTNTPQPSIFGSTTNSATPSIFGGSTSNQPSMFGTSSTTNSPSIFGGSTSPPPFNVVGQSNTFSSSTTPASNFTFKLPEQVGSGPGAGGSMFGGQIPTGHNVFGPSLNDQKGSIFSGFQPIPGLQPSENTSVMKANGKPDLSSSVRVGVSSIYTDLCALTPDEKKGFTAATFTAGRIPVRPPPKELCD